MANVHAVHAANNWDTTPRSQIFPGSKHLVHDLMAGSGSGRDDMRLVHKP